MTISPSDSGLLVPSNAPNELAVDELILGGKSIPNVKVCVRYGRDFDFHLSFETDQNISFGSAFDGGADSLRIGEVETKLLRTKTQFGSNMGVEMDFVTQISPALLFQKELPRSFKFSVANGPVLHFKPFTLKANDGEYNFALNENENAKALRESSKYSNEPLLTGSVEISRVDEEPFDFVDAWKAGFRFLNFLTFVRGDTVSFGHCLGFDSDGENVLLAAGFSRIASPKAILNWCGVGQIKELSQLAERYFDSLSDAAKSEVLARTFEFYRSSGGIRSTSLEMAIVASSAALEVIVPYILKERGKFDGNMLGERIPFHSKLRACFGIIGLDVDPFEGLSALQKQAASLNNVDAFELSTIYRNRIVHQGRQFPVSGKQLVEMWNFQMWMTEVLLLYVMGHDGTMFDRRPLSTWVGHGSKVPFSI